MSAKQTETHEWVEREGKRGVVYVDPNGVAYIPRQSKKDMKPEEQSVVSLADQLSAPE